MDVVVAAHRVYPVARQIDHWPSCVVDLMTVGRRQFPDAGKVFATIPASGNFSVEREHHLMAVVLCASAAPDRCLLACRVGSSHVREVCRGGRWLFPVRFGDSDDLAGSVPSGATNNNRQFSGLHVVSCWSRTLPCATRSSSWVATVTFQSCWVPCRATEVPTTVSGD